MRVSIITDDNRVVVDGEGRTLDDGMAALRDARVQALQWYHDFGEREFQSVFLKDEKRWDRRPNEIFDDEAEVMKYVELWKLTKTDRERELERFENDKHRHQPSDPAERT